MAAATSAAGKKGNTLGSPQQIYAAPGSAGSSSSSSLDVYSHVRVINVHTCITYIYIYAVQSQWILAEDIMRYACERCDRSLLCPVKVGRSPIFFLSLGVRDFRYIEGVPARGSSIVAGGS